MFKSILVVCVANICRSPMAEALLKIKAPEGVLVHSAGIAALAGERADPEVLKLMQDRGINIAEHRARQLTPQMAQETDIILVMEAGHQDYIHSILPASRGRVYLLGKWSDLDVPDPYRKSPEYFEHVLALIEQGVDGWAERLWGATKGS